MSKEFLGRGWKFPVKLSSIGSIDESQYEVDIKEAIKIIATTSMGERVMLPEFGCGIYDYVFESPSTTILGLIQESVRNSLIKWEPRIDLNDVSVSMEGSDKNKLLIEISYTVRTTNNQYNLVYPFYLKE
ncbi:MAG: Gene 25-like lysozyme [Methanosaeta sp. PtaU1.Bin060]|jgi:phage baseplate assembly protein W|nr:MAG: Gene 25-like lysozyme [Methanosaeta sp. PtaU1.Bin060]